MAFNEPCCVYTMGPLLEALSSVKYHLSWVNNYSNYLFRYSSHCSLVPTHFDRVFDAFQGVVHLTLSCGEGGDRHGFGLCLFSLHSFGLMSGFMTFALTAVNFTVILGGLRVQLVGDFKGLPRNIPDQQSELDSFLKDNILFYPFIKIFDYHC